MPTLHMSFTGNPGTGKTTVALRIASILHKLGFVRRGQVISVTRDELVGQYIGHTAPKTKEILKKAMGGVLFIDEAYYLHRPDNERDYGQEAIEILLQVMEIQREDLVVILAGYGDRMDRFFASNPGFRSRIAHHIDFPDYSDDELLAIAELMLRDMNYRFTPEAREAFIRYIALRKTQPLFSNARSIRNALDRMRLRQANRLVADLDPHVDGGRYHVVRGVGRAGEPGVLEGEPGQANPAAPHPRRSRRRRCRSPSSPASRACTEIFSAKNRATVDVALRIAGVAIALGGQRFAGQHAAAERRAEQAQIGRGARQRVVRRGSDALQQPFAGCAPASRARRAVWRPWCRRRDRSRPRPA